MYDPQLGFVLTLRIVKDKNIFFLLSTVWIFYLQNFMSYRQKTGEKIAKFHDSGGHFYHDFIFNVFQKLF